jgi:hypothetical protein
MKPILGYEVHTPETSEKEIRSPRGINAFAFLTGFVLLQDWIMKEVCPLCLVSSEHTCFALPISTMNCGSMKL